MGGYLKELIRTGDKPIVGTAYADKGKNYCYRPAEIYGVVLRIMDMDGKEIWTRPPEVSCCRDCVHGDERKGR